MEFKCSSFNFDSMVTCWKGTLFFWWGGGGCLMEYFKTKMLSHDIFWRSLLFGILPWPYLLKIHSEMITFKTRSLPIAELTAWPICINMTIIYWATTRIFSPVLNICKMFCSFQAYLQWSWLTWFICSPHALYHSSPKGLYFIMVSIHIVGEVCTGQ